MYNCMPINYIPYDKVGEESVSEITERHKLLKLKNKQKIEYVFSKQRDLISNLNYSHQEKLQR